MLCAMQSGVFYFFAAFCFAQAIYFYFFLPETKGLHIEQVSPREQAIGFLICAQYDLNKAYILSGAGLL